MLGGPVYIAFIRYAISFVGVVLLFSLMSESRYSRKKTVICYAGFGAVLIAGACIWYRIDWQSCARMAALVMYMCFTVFAAYISRDQIYLSVYKLALTFYLMAVYLIGGIEVSVIFFDRNVWADIIVRMILIAAMTLFINAKIKSYIRGFSYYVENELDQFSVAVMIISLLFGIGFILNPNISEHTPYRLFQIMINFFLTGALQFLVFRLYLHIGKEKAYQQENQLMQMNHRLLERNMELLEEYNKSAGENYPDKVCVNAAVNNILAAYTKKARQEQIKVTLDIEQKKNLGIPNIDLVTILANAYENAIYGCMEVKKQSKERECAIHLMLKKKNNKLVIYCSNTCRVETEIKNGQPRPEATGGIGVSSIIRTAEKFDGEYDFKNDNGLFVFRIIMNIPSVAAC